MSGRKQSLRSWLNEKDYDGWYNPNNGNSGQWEFLAFVQVYRNTGPGTVIDESRYDTLVSDWFDSLSRPDIEAGQEQAPRKKFLGLF